MKRTLTMLLILCCIITAIPVSAHPSEYITRLEFCRLADKMLIQSDIIQNNTDAVSPFCDTDDKAVVNLFRYAIIAGTGENTFSPDAFLTREETAVIIDRIFRNTDNKNDTVPDQITYADANSISEWAIDSVKRMKEYNVMIGTDNDTFDPKGTLTSQQANLILLRVQDKLNPNAVTELSLENTLEALTQTSRWAGTEDDENAKKYLFDTFSRYGYSVEEQTFDFEDKGAIHGLQTKNSTANIIATKKSDTPDCDILIISSHFDTIPGTAGANDNASGTTVLLETAKAVSNLKTDTEIRFVAFGAEEQGRLGSAYYVSKLSDEEKSRIIGDIQLDMLGHYKSEEILIKTPSNEETLVGNLVNESAQKILGTPLKTAIESASDHTSFITGGIPAILLMQNNIGVENHKITDTANIISEKKLKEISDILIDTIKNVASDESKGLSELAYQITDMKNPAYTVHDETIFFFNEKKYLNDGRIGGPGKLTGTRRDDDLGWDFETYSYNARWFDLEQPVPTIFEYRVLNGDRYLQSITIDFKNSVYSIEQIKKILTEKYGEPDVSKDDLIWKSPRFVKQYILKEGESTVGVSSYFFGAGKTIKKYDVSDGISKYSDAPEKEYKLLKFLQNIISDDGLVDTLEIWSDGLSYQLGASYPNNSTRNDKFTIRIDIEDVFDENGNYRNLDKTLVTFVHEYGHVLTLNHTQTDITKKDPNRFYFNCESFLEGSYILDFYNQFWKDLNTETGRKLYFENPEMFINEYSCQDVNEDIAESFAMFVLTDKASGNTIAEQKINFFYEYPKMVEIRNKIRNAFCL